MWVSSIASDLLTKAQKAQEQPEAHRRLDKIKASSPPYPEIYPLVAAIANHADYENQIRNSLVYYDLPSVSRGRKKEAEYRLSLIEFSRPHPEIYDSVVAILKCIESDRRSRIG
jgi:hypothetical protein